MNSKVYKSYPQIELLHFPQVSTQTVTRMEKTQSSIDLSFHSNNFEEEGTMAQYPNYKATTVCQNWLDFSTLMFDGSTVSLMWQYKNFSQSIINFYTKGEIHSKKKYLFWNIYFFWTLTSTKISTEFIVDYLFKWSLWVATSISKHFTLQALTNSSHLKSPGTCFAFTDVQSLCSL